MSKEIVDVPSPNPLETGLVVSPFTRRFHPEFVAGFEKRLGENLPLRVDYARQPSDMPIDLVGAADKTIQLAWFDGSNWQETIVDIARLGNALTESPDAAGANTRNHFLLFPFADLRGHKRTRKLIPGSAGRSIVKAEGLNNSMLVKLMKHVAGASGAVFVDMHNSWESRIPFLEQGLPFINLSTNQLFCDFLLKNNLVNNPGLTRVWAADLGDLPESVDFAQKLGQAMGHNQAIALGVNVKYRDGDNLIEEFHRAYTDSDEGCTIVVKDDIYGRGSTTEKVVKRALESKAKKIIFYATHGVFSDDYYKILSTLLKDPRVTLVTSNSLPRVRNGITYALPYGLTDKEEINQMMVMPIDEWLADRTKTIFKSESIKAAKMALRDEIMEPQDPYALFEQIMGKKIPKPEDTAIYIGVGKTIPLPLREILFEI